MADTIDSLGLTPQERNLYSHHLANMQSLRFTMNPNGSHSSVRQAVVTGPNGKFYSIPTIWNGKELPVREAMQMAAKAGWDNWPSYDTPEQADARYNDMHKFMEQDVPNLSPVFGAGQQPDLTHFDYQKAVLYNQLYGDPLPSAGGAAFGTGAYNQNQRDIQAYGRGQADPTLENISKAVGFGLGLGPTSPFTMAAGAGLNAAFKTDTGIGLPSFTGFVGPTPAGRALIARGGTLGQAQARDRGAVDSRGQVRGGGTGSRGGGLTAGGPR